MRYLNIRKGQFSFANKSMGTYIEAPLRLVGKRILQWGPTGLIGERICYDESQVPNGWTLAYDLDLELDNIRYRLTIHGGAIKHAFKPYLALLTSRGSQLESVTTLISIENNTRGYPALKFGLAT